ncbi:unnamed protein product [Acanthoscelides obtectus]|uniref:HTH psq-type domain-containing protein n=1 Tax=Acanthoscelides obtectus TaxID=200917 RepID=A0A9P0Q5H5_ACAOB|nr:unnamed protein product [Acanthoscelides obtectus]CAK1633611.1 hypothetical protein AOBTE_LOCUS8255 [Acanthoscelides obtectus]
MPKQSKKRKQWSKENMIRAVKAVTNKETGYQKASKLYEVPKGTLERYVKDDRNPEELVNVKVARRRALPLEL